MKKKLNLFLLSLIIISCGGKPQTNDFEPIIKISTKKVASIDSIFFKYNNSTPGYAVSIVQNGEIVFLKTYGMAKPKKGVQISPDTKFPIGSNTKQFTCMAVLLLEEQGKLNINDPIIDYLPKLPDFAKNVTIEHLMNHTSGIMEFNPLLFLSGLDKNECNLTNDEIFALTSKYQKASFEVGDHFFYSNSAYVLLAKIIERASNQTYADFIQENIFNPLGMNESKVVTSKNDYRDVAIGFENRRNYRPVDCRMVTTGASGIITTMHDLITWTNNYYKNELGFKNQNLVNQMQTKGGLNNGDSLVYGLGLFIENQCGQKIISHSGRIPGYTSNITLLPNQHTSIIVLSNTTDRIPFKHRYDIAKILLDSSCEFSIEPFPGMDLVKNNALSKSNIFLTDYEGIYSINEFPREFDISINDGQLIANIANMTFKLKKHSIDIFISEPMIFQFIRDDKGLVTGFLLHGEKFRNLELKRKN